MRWRRLIPTLLLPWLSVLFLVVLLLGPTSFLVWLLLFTNTFSVQAITVLDAREHTITAARAQATEHLTAVPFGQSILFVAAETIATTIASQLPQVRTVQVRRQLPGTLRIVIQEKTPALLLFSHGDYYLVDESGIPYEEAQLETLPGIVVPTIKNTATAGEVTIGVPALSPEFVSFVTEVQESLPHAIDAEVAEMRIPSLAAREVHFYVNTNWHVRFDSTRSASTQLNVLRRGVQETIPAEALSQLDYIDLRIPDRVYYKGVDTATKSEETES